MTNLPQFAQTLAKTPRLKRKFVTTNTLSNASLAPDHMYVEADGVTPLEREVGKDRYIGRIAKVKRSSYQWEVWSFARGIEDKRKFTIIAKGRSKTPLAALSRVRFEFAQYHARRDAAKEAAAA